MRKHITLTAAAVAVFAVVALRRFNRRLEQACALPVYDERRHPSIYGSLPAVLSPGHHEPSLREMDYLTPSEYLLMHHPRGCDCSTHMVATRAAVDADRIARRNGFTRDYLNYWEDPR